MARFYIRPQSPRGITLGVAVVLWLVGALEMLAGMELPFDLGQFALLIGRRAADPGLPAQGAVKYPVPDSDDLSTCFLLLPRAALACAPRGRAGAADAIAWTS